MSFRYRFDVLEALREIGCTDLQLLEALQRGEPVTVRAVTAICGLLGCGAHDLLEEVPEGGDACRRATGAPVRR